MNLIYRKSKRFVVDDSQIKEEFRTSSVINGLYAALYDEFRGASVNKKYANKTPQEKMELVNQFAYNWLKQRGFI